MPIGGRDAILLEDEEVTLLLETSAVIGVGVAAILGGRSEVNVFTSGRPTSFRLSFKDRAEAEERAFGIAAACGFAPTAAQRLRRVR